MGVSFNPAVASSVPAAGAEGAAGVLQGGAMPMGVETGITAVDRDVAWVSAPGFTAQVSGLLAGGAAAKSSLTPVQQQQLQIIGTSVQGGISSPELESRWAAFVADMAASGNGGVDANALVQAVLREAYLQSTEDLRFYAEKVKFYNNLKKQIREELTRARKELAKYAHQGAGEDVALSPPYLTQWFQVDYLGRQQPADPVAQTQGTGLSGRGVRAYDGKPALRPAPTAGQTYVTADGYVIHADPSHHQVTMYGPDGMQITKIWGDPHVNEGQSTESNWHFGNDSTFVLPDGTKVCLDTEEQPPNSGIFITVGVDILSGNERASIGKDPSTGAWRDGREIIADRAEWDAAHADAGAGVDAGVFMLGSDGQWKKYGAGKLQDVSDKSWREYQGDRRIGVGGDKTAATAAQIGAAADGTEVRAQGQGKTCNTKAELDAYIRELEEKLNSVSDDAQLANVDLQNMLQRQQQVLQTLSNISKLLHDTAMATIRKLAG